VKDPRKRIEYLMIITLICIGYFYIYVYQNMIGIDVPFIGLESLIELPIIAIIVIPLVKLIIVKSDPLQRSSSKNKTIRFFQKEFPSNYIFNRCQTCIENENTCINYINPGSYAHISYWFRDLFHGKIERDDPMVIKETFEKGYTCKLVFYLSWVLLIFFILSLVTTGVHYIILYLTDNLVFALIAWQIIFPVLCLSIWGLIKILNRPDEKNLSGCWQAWRQINGIHVSWLGSNESLLVDLICHANSGTKHYLKRV